MHRHGERFGKVLMYERAPLAVCAHLDMPCLDDVGCSAIWSGCDAGSGLRPWREFVYVAYVVIGLRLNAVGQGKADFQVHRVESVRIEFRSQVEVRAAEHGVNIKEAMRSRRGVVAACEYLLHLLQGLVLTGIG